MIDFEQVRRKALLEETLAWLTMWDREPDTAAKLTTNISAIKFADIARELLAPRPEGREPIISAGGAFDLKLYGTPFYFGQMMGLKCYVDPTVPENTVIIKDEFDRELGRIINIGGSSPQAQLQKEKP